MTRLTTDDIDDIPTNIQSHDKKIELQTGSNLAKIAAFSAGIEGSLEALFRDNKAKAVSVSSGQGVISGFSLAVSAILNHIGLRTEIATKPDVGGFAEAFKDNCKIIFAADDEFFVGFNTRLSKISYNYEATGRGYSAALELKVKGLEGRKVALIGAGRVGSAAAEYMSRKGAKVFTYDPITEKVQKLSHLFPSSVVPCASVRDCLARSEHAFLAAPGTKFIDGPMFPEDMVFAAPALPLGFTDSGWKKLKEENLIHDNLGLGVATMAAEIIV
jgi:pyrrolysine biosynthesis protein PylD